MHPINLSSNYFANLVLSYSPKLNSLHGQGNSIIYRILLLLYVEPLQLSIHPTQLVCYLYLALRKDYWYGKGV